VEPSSVLVPPGTNATLACLVSNMGNKGECRWQKNGKPVGLFPGKYSLPTSSSHLGDCSLTIASVDVRLDDGAWNCQVTSSNISLQDALVSRPAYLTVQVPPSSISILSLTLPLQEGALLAVTENKTETITCITRHSNPPPTISWLIGDLLLHSTSQNNTSEVGSTKWRSEATLQHVFLKSDQSKSLQDLQCVVKHIAYPTGQNTMHATLDVLYKPSVHIARVSSPVLENGSGSLSLTCIAESNPPARVMWSKVGEDCAPEYKEILQFNPVTREEAGTYVCQAENSVGWSVKEHTEVDVLYAPFNLRTDPLLEASVLVNNKTVLSCKAEANPEPTYEWLQQLASGQVRRRSKTAHLLIEDVRYEDQGEYSCMASNSIGGEMRQVQSEVVRLDVAGVPLVVKDLGEVVGVNGRDVILEGEFCSDPGPVKNTWEWGGVVLPAGSEVDGRYKAELVPHPHIEDCYISRLTVRKAGKEDSRRYTLSVENKHGRDMVPVMLNIKDPVSMIVMIAVVFALLLIIIFMVISFLIAYNKQMFCFKGFKKEKKASPENEGYINHASKLSLVSDASSEYARSFPPSTKV